MSATTKRGAGWLHWLAGCWLAAGWLAGWRWLAYGLFFREQKEIAKAKAADARSNGNGDPESSRAYPRELWLCFIFKIYYN
jgi:hypothetical protein